MSALDQFLSGLHDRIGVCGHCGIPNCPDREGYSLLPNNISVDDFVGLGKIAKSLQSALQEMLELHGGYSDGDEPKAHQVARELLGALSPDDAEFGMGEHRGHEFLCSLYRCRTWRECESAGKCLNPR